MRSESVLFSIITPIRNGLDYIDTYLESLLKQNYRNWEAIIIDDNSNDGDDLYVFPQAALSSSTLYNVPDCSLLKKWQDLHTVPGDPKWGFNSHRGTCRCINNTCELED